MERPQADKFLESCCVTKGVESLYANLYGTVVQLGSIQCFLIIKLNNEIQLIYDSPCGELKY